MYSNELICNILEFLDDNLNRKLSIDEIALKFYYNRYYIMKLFKKELGITIAVYMNQMRIYHSLFHIQRENYSLTRIAIQNGFYSLEYFSEMFHNIMEVSPRIYQEYCNHSFKITDEEIEKIRKNMAELQSLVNFIHEYKKNKRPKGVPVLKRSIFS